MNHLSCPQQTYTLQAIADWQLKSDSCVIIPRMQRGLVWNPARIEVFWDSLMREIPVGVFCLSKLSHEMASQIKDGEQCVDKEYYFLLDGQQRANAIAMAFRPFPPTNKDIRAPVLWLDLNPQSYDERCKFAFYVCTQAHPWGFLSRTGDRETSNEKLSSREMKEFAATIFSENPEEYFKKHPDFRPLPSQLYPKRAVLPIPSWLLMSEGKVDDVLNRAKSMAKETGSSCPRVGDFGHFRMNVGAVQGLPTTAPGGS